MLEHPVVYDLVRNGWVHLHQLEADRQGVFRWENEGWTRVDDAEPMLRVS